MYSLIVTYEHHPQTYSADADLTIGPVSGYETEDAAHEAAANMVRICGIRRVDVVVHCGTYRA